jgi:hypothetical protein
VRARLKEFHEPEVDCRDADDCRWAGLCAGLDSVYGAVLAVALWMIIDLDYPGIGLIRVGNLPVVETLAAMH